MTGTKKEKSLQCEKYMKEQWIGFDGRPAADGSDLRYLSLLPSLILWHTQMVICFFLVMTSYRTTRFLVSTLASKYNFSFTFAVMPLWTRLNILELLPQTFVTVKDNPFSVKFDLSLYCKTKSKVKLLTLIEGGTSAIKYKGRRYGVPISSCTFEDP